MKNFLESLNKKVTGKTLLLYITVILSVNYFLFYIVFVPKIVNETLVISQLNISKNSAVQSAKSDVTISAIAQKIKSNMVYKELRDPFEVDFRYEKSPVISKEAKAPSTEKKEAKPVKKLFVLQGILKTGEGDIIALIDDNVLHVGERVNGWTVNSIENDKVVLARGSKRKVLTLSFEGE